MPHGIDLIDNNEGREDARFVLVDRLYELGVPRMDTYSAKWKPVPRCGYFENEMTGQHYFVLPLPDIVRLWREPLVRELTLAAMELGAPRILLYWAKWYARQRRHAKTPKPHVIGPTKLVAIPWEKATPKDMAEAFGVRRIPMGRPRERRVVPRLPEEGRRVDIDCTNMRFLNAGDVWIPAGARVSLQPGKPGWVVRRGRPGTSSPGWMELGRAAMDIEPWQVGIVAVESRALSMATREQLSWLQTRPERRLRLNGTPLVITVLQEEIAWPIGAAFTYLHPWPFHIVEKCTHELAISLVNVGTDDEPHPIEVLVSDVCGKGFVTTTRFLPDRQLLEAIEQHHGPVNWLWNRELKRVGPGWKKSVNQVEDP